MRALKATVGLVAVAALLAGCSSGSDEPGSAKGGKKTGSSGSQGGSGGGSAAGDGKRSVEFKVTSNLPLDLALGGTTPDSGHTEEIKNVKAPWSKTYKVDPDRYPSIAVGPVDAAKKGKVTCEMLVDGKSVDKDSGQGTGSSLAVSCSGST
ncbi:hypothetical protein FCH28_10635 [Streptomyces piniterrae]|uniref:MmpS family membrane protein n=1 Tax=Streptomyces piniterrae TaxID=2571125 RepID=A0A4U0NN70_9ACTN|nr:hypothetical protein [Streptomyces piniterrae]TJZ55760.1 hypothetical protein FCH28_10635 [Streptomyces piniterrae]